MGGYLGIDESNHGKTPEIFVGVYSPRKADSHCLSHLLSKDRYTHTIPDDVIYRHVLISSTIRCQANDDLIKIIAANELIRFFSTYESGLSRVLFDGSGNEQVLEDLLRMLHPIKPRIDFIPKSDQKYHLVHEADMIAYNLARYYCDPTTFDLGIVENRINVDLNKYSEILGKYCRD